MKIVIELTVEEIAEMFKARYNIYCDVDVKIVKHYESEWIAVPANWSKFYSPNGEGENTPIEAKYRSGETTVGIVAQFFAGWSQDGTEFDIVAYRILK